jgi:hypothetical protein
MIVVAVAHAASDSPAASTESLELMGSLPAGPARAIAANDSLVVIGLEY